DPTSGKDYLRNRWFEAEVGFVSRDLLDYIDGLSVYIGYFSDGGLDPLGLWTWKMDRFGRIIAVRENGDTIDTLADQGYDRSKMKELPDGNVDVSAEFPELILADFARQQTYKTKDIPDVWAMAIHGYDDDGSAIGTDIRKVCDTLGELDPRIAKDLNAVDDIFGPGQCHGFTFFATRSPSPPGHLENAPDDLEFSPRNITMAWGTGARSDEWHYSHHGGTESIAYGVGSGRTDGDAALQEFLTEGRAETANAEFGDILIFFDETGNVVHSGVAMGVDASGRCFVLQKVNRGRPYTISPAEDFTDWTYEAWEIKQQPPKDQ
ncbi:MAG TPA: hypothetical protein PLN52_26530, partial [Opitutaceae bacterium]|nr:hypothetical protein [Opitutaceae bacterium]